MKFITLFAFALPLLGAVSATPTENRVLAKIREVLPHLELGEILPHLETRQNDFCDNCISFCNPTGPGDFGNPIGCIIGCCGSCGNC
ncbi:hypothetical protein M422DRAFT_245968 [Sphaerobolus stellatus SS14]|nr:hypothetical protein M422DRAFT_245968 [Sphaerobolus stellatus SS14]